MKDVYTLRLPRARLKRLQARLRAKGIETWKKVKERMTERYAA